MAKRRGDWHHKTHGEMIAAHGGTDRIAGGITRNHQTAGRHVSGSHQTAGGRHVSGSHQTSFRFGVKLVFPVVQDAFMRG